jgi:hypothetical protein
MRKLSLSALALLAIALPSAAAAQDNATMNVTANVLGPINVAVDRALDFGDVLPGVAYDIPSSDVGSAGIFAITGNGGSEVDLEFTTLPAELSDGTNTMTITWSAGYGSSIGAQDAAFTPASGATTALSGVGELFVFLGGAFTPAVDQATGAYDADVTLTVTYTGN